MDGCFKWLIILIILAIVIPLIVGGGLLALLVGFLDAIFSDWQTAVAFISIVFIIVSIIVNIAN